MRWLPGSLATPTRQPVGAARVDRGNPISRGLFLCHTPGFANGALAFTRDAVVRNGVAAVSRGLLSTDPRVAGPITVLLCFRTPSVLPHASNDCVITQGGSSPAANNQGFAFNAWHGNASYSGALYGGTSYGIIGKPTGGVLAANTDYVIAFSVDASGAAAGYNNGVRTVSGTIAARATDARLTINANSALSPAQDDGANLFSCILVWSRVLSDAEVAQVSANPWQLFERPARPLWAPAATVTVYRPGSDVIVTGWTATGAASIAAALSDASLSNFGTSPDLSSPATLTWQSAMPAGSYSIPVTLDRTGASGSVRLVLLDAGGTPVGTTAWQAAPATAAEITFSVTTSATSTQFRIEVQP